VSKLILKNGEPIDDFLAKNIPSEKASLALGSS
jgi:hypothetical protein